MSDAVPWDELSRKQQEAFAALCDRFVGIDTVDDAKKYYGNKDKLKEDARAVGLDDE